jgi:hypothetical protein
MVAVRTVVAGLSTSDLEHIRDSLAGGRKPKVVFTESAGQMAGQQGQVVQLTDPQLSDEWVVVRFGRDELPFSPADLAIPAKSASTRRADGRAAAVNAVAPPPAAVSPVPPVPREEIAVAASPTSTLDIPVAGPAVSSGATDSAGSERKSARKPAPKAKVPAALTVTLAYADGEWTVAAQQGTKALAKPYVIKAAEALKMVGMLDVPGVHDAVEEIVTAARAQAQQQALRLRAELAEIEARLAELAVE